MNLKGAILLEEKNYEELAKRISYLEKEVEKLKKSNQLDTNSEESLITTKKSFEEQTVKLEPKTFTNPLVAKVKPIQQKTKVKKEPVEFDFEKLLGTWLPRLFMVILIFGVLWGLKVGMDNGIITNPIRIVLGYGGTILLALVGLRYLKTKNKMFGLTLLGGFIALGMLTTFAAHNLYGYFNEYVSFAISLTYIIIGFVISSKTKSEALTLFSSFAAFLLPFLLEDSNASSLQFIVYILLLFMVSFYISLKEGHKYTFYVIFAFFHSTLLIDHLIPMKGEEDYYAVVAVLIQHMFILLLYVKKKISTRIFSEVLLYTNFVSAMFWVKLLHVEQEPLIYGLIALMYVLLTIQAFKEKEDYLKGILTAISVFAVGLFIISFQFENQNSHLLLLTLDGAVGLWVGMQFKSIRTLITSSTVYVLTVSTIVTNVRISEFWSLEHLSWVAILISLGFVYRGAYKFLPKNYNIKEKFIDISLIVGQILLVVYSIGLTSILWNKFNIPYGMEEHILILVVLLILSALYFTYKWTHGKYVAYAVLIEFLLIGLITITSIISSGETDAEFFFNLGVEVLFITLITYLFLLIRNKTFFISFGGKEITDKIAIGIQIVYFIFLNKIYLESADYFNLDSDYTYLIHTLLLFTFAFLSISIGRKQNWKHVKIIGALLIIACVFKLFFVDLGSVSLLIRAILFILVGVVGLIYSRSLFNKK